MIKRTQLASLQGQIRERLPFVKTKKLRTRRVKTPTVLQMEAVECGAASLAIILGFFGRTVPLEELRTACGVSRDGTKASNMIKAGQEYGLTGRGFRKEVEDLSELPLPFVVFWNFNHFLVVEGFGRDWVYLNDPAYGPRKVSWQEFDEGFTGVVLVFEPNANFLKASVQRSLATVLYQRFVGVQHGLAYTMLAGLTLVILGLIIPSFTRVFVDSYLVDRGEGWVLPVLLGMALAAGMRFALTWLQQTYLLRLETRIAVTTSSQFLLHVLHLPMEFFTQRYGGEVVSRVRLNDAVAQLLTRDLATTGIDVVMLVFFTVLMFQYDVLLTLGCIVIALLNLLALRYISRRRTDASQRLLQESGKLLGVSLSGLQMIETLKVTGTEDDFFARWSGYFAKVSNARQELDVLSSFLSVVPPLLTTSSTVAILAVGALRVMDGHMTIGMLVAFQALAGAFLSPVSRLVSLGGSLQEMHGNINRLDDVLQNKTDTALVEVLNENVDTPATLSGQVELRNITFGYSRLEQPLIENFNLILHPGNRVALVGGSGSGKSTIARLIAGLFQPWTGEILFDGQLHHSVPRQALQNSLAVVDQDIFLFEGTVRDNLTLWKRGVSETEIVCAARDACIHEDIVARPGGYDGHIEEGGRNFSGGQRQRLEIARALIGRPTLLVLDEATSALDPVTEYTIDDNLRRRGCTCLIVAHRLSTIRDCDEIIVLQQGKVMQRGTHESLRDVPGPYSDLIQAEE